MCKNREQKRFSCTANFLRRHNDGGITKTRIEKSFNNSDELLVWLGEVVRNNENAANTLEGFDVYNTKHSLEND